jgi:hypothetical protein
VIALIKDLFSVKKEGRRSNVVLCLSVNSFLEKAPAAMFSNDDLSPGKNRLIVSSLLRRSPSHNWIPRDHFLEVKERQKNNEVIGSEK